MKNSLKIQALNAPKYVLYNKVYGYLSDDQTLSSVNFTKDINEARQFSIGFDDPNQKVGTWNAMGKIKLGISNLFEIINL